MSPKTAIKIMLSMVAILLFFHLAILLKIIPYDITWGGRLQNDSEMYVFESLSIVINVLLLIVLLIKGRYIKQLISPKAIDLILWFFLALFGLNTIGNIFAVSYFEKSFAILTLLFTALIWFILKGSDKK